MDPEVIVRGEGEALAMPDRAIVHIGIEGEARTRDEAYQSAAARAGAVDEVVARSQSILEKAATTSLVVRPKVQWRDGEAVRTGWQASRTSVLEVVDFDGMGELLGELSSAGASINGPYWQIDRGNAAHGEARRRAAVDARRRADDYAAALGLGVGAVLWIAEPGLRQTDVAHPADGARGMLAESADAGPDIIDVSPDEMTLRVAVEVGFSLVSGLAAG